MAKRKPKDESEPTLIPEPFACPIYIQGEHKGPIGLDMRFDEAQKYAEKNGGVVVPGVLIDSGRATKIAELLERSKSKLSRELGAEIVKALTVLEGVPK